MKLLSGEKPSGEPSCGSGRKPQVKRLPKRPAAKLMPRRLKITKTTAKVPGKNRFKNQETKRCEKAKSEEIKKTVQRTACSAFEIPARPGLTANSKLFRAYFSQKRDNGSQANRQGAESFQLRNQVFPGTHGRLVLAASVVTRVT